MKDFTVVGKFDTQQNAKAAKRRLLTNAKGCFTSISQRDKIVTITRTFILLGLPEVQEDYDIIVDILESSPGYSHPKSKENVRDSKLKKLLQC